MDEEKSNEANENKERKVPLKESVYDRIPLTVKQLDVIIAVLVVAFIAFFIIGALKGNGYF